MGLLAVHALRSCCACRAQRTAAWFTCVCCACRHGGFYYYTRTQEGQQYKIHCRRAVPAGAGPPTEADIMDEALPEEVLLDENHRRVGVRGAASLLWCCGAVYGCTVLLC